MRQLSSFALAGALVLSAPAARAAVDWTFVIENPDVVVDPLDSFSIRGRITNLATSTASLTVAQPCEGCVVPVSLLIGAEGGAIWDLYAIDMTLAGKALAGVSLAPGESFSFTAYAGVPSHGPVPAGRYRLAFHGLYLAGYDLSGDGLGNPVSITVVPEPSSLALAIAGAAFVAAARRPRHASA